MADQTVVLYIKYWPKVYKDQLLVGLQALLDEQGSTVSGITFTRPTKPERTVATLQSISKFLVVDTGILRRKLEAQ